MHQNIKKQERATPENRKAEKAAEESEKKAK
jgi:hypothetical protein